VDVGCVRLTERHLHSDPPTPPSSRRPRRRRRRARPGGRRGPAASAPTLVGLAGSVTTVTAHALGLPRYDPVAHPPRRAAGATCGRRATSCAMSRAERAALPYMHPGRVDVIGAAP
jgi:exopolyphosphatase/guanosine-5'-triphosphate,3'-diphosphate pyrophosphatase